MNEKTKIYQRHTKKLLDEFEKQERIRMVKRVNAKVSVMNTQKQSINKSLFKKLCLFHKFNNLNLLNLFQTKKE